MLGFETGLAGAVVEHLADGVLVIVDGEVVLANPAMARLAGAAVLEGAPAPDWIPRVRGTLADLETTLHGRPVTISSTPLDGAQLITVRDRTEQVELVRLAHRDGLTGLLNQKSFTIRLHEEAERLAAVERPLGLIVVDLDHFKRVNDEHGHPTGDRVLKETAERISGVARAIDSVGRLGGEEFGWLLPDASAEQLLTAAERLRERFASTPFAGGLRVTVSVGFCDLATAGSVEALMQHADEALYWAKETGRDAALGWTPATDERLRRVRASRGAIGALAEIADELDPATDQGHGERVAALAAALAISQGWAPRDQARMHQAGRLHDLGKAAISESVLGRPGPLAPLEHTHVRAHAAIGAALAEDAVDAEQADWIRHHHAPWQAAPEGAQLLAIADTWDAMTSDRCYRPALDRDAAIAELERVSGTQLHPEAPRLVRAALDWFSPG
jgi:diguanylate cyclase (GGDEF)-like protein